MKIYRVEHKTIPSAAIQGVMQGVYCFTSDLFAGFLDVDRHLFPEQDGQLMRSLGQSSCLKYAFGFESIEHLRHWFYNDKLNARLDQEYRINVYETEEYHLGSSQAVFRPSQLVGTLRIMELDSREPSLFMRNNDRFTSGNNN